MVARRSHRRALAVTALGVAWLLTAGACTHRDRRPRPGTTRTTATTRPAETTTTTTAPPGATVVATGLEARAEVAREQVSETAARPATAAISRLGAALYRQIIAEHPDENLALSPMSIEAALAMTRHGAVGETRREMDEVLGATTAGAGDSLDQALNALDTVLAGHNGPVSSGASTGEVGLRTSNELWAQDGFVIYASFLDVLARHYGAGVNVVDFEHATEQARTRINEFVAGQTNGRITELIASGEVDELTRFVLTNTLWFKAPWTHEFAAAGDRTFHLADGSTVDVPTMAAAAGGDIAVLPGGYGEGTGWKAAELPYLGGDLSMVVIVPDDLAAFEAGLDGPGLTAITGGLSGELRSVQMPKWTTRSRFSLPDQLEAIGMRRAFDPVHAEFTALSPRNTVITDVLHQVFVAVDEKGTEAAAATAVVGGHGSWTEPRGTALVVDRPFLYVIRDRVTGAVLFLGRVVDPSEVDS